MSPTPSQGRHTPTDEEESQETLCVECGPDVAFDEDGCCITCGGYAIGPWAATYAEVVREKTALTAERDALVARVEQLRAQLATVQEWFLSSAPSRDLEMRAGAILDPAGVRTRFAEFLSQAQEKP